ncbi:MAG: hypothetical protein INR73_07235 [Williamsia sp.]|nr:hypothetical protein [Williamsia sp.]
MQYPKILLVVCLLIFSVALFSKCGSNGQPSTKDPRGDAYAGMQTCIACHQDVFASYTHSNHAKTSWAIHDTVLDKTAPSTRPFYFQDSSRVVIEEGNDSLFQSYFVNGRKTVSNQFDIAFGSGEKAQTYASWQKDQLLQLPLSYYSSLHDWANSPGFPASHARFERVIVSRCFECHASYVEKEFVQSGPLAVSEKLDRNSIIYGIDCERCHGPASEHVQFHREHPAAKTPMYMVSLRSLNRRRQLDVCAVCHSGNDQATQRAVFGFRPGDTLSNFYYPDFDARNKEPDVHGKQLQLLGMSRCYQQTGMTCMTCHNPHDEGKGTNGYIATCMNCHRQSSHALEMLKETRTQDARSGMQRPDCLDCHMPLQASKTIYFSNSTGAKVIPYYLRTHRIAVYKDSIQTSQKE